MIVLIFIAWYLWELWDNYELSQLAYKAPVIRIPIDAKQYEREQEAKYQARQRVREKVAEREERDVNLVDEETQTFEWIVNN